MYDRSGSCGSVTVGMVGMVGMVGTVVVLHLMERCFLFVLCGVVWFIGIFNCADVCPKGLNPGEWGRVLHVRVYACACLRCPKVL